MQTVPCPKCGRLLEQSGEIAVESGVFPVYQCDACIQTELIEGQPFAVAYTFCLDAAGTPFNPADRAPETN